MKKNIYTTALINTCLFILCLSISHHAKAQTLSNNPVLAVLDFDSQGMDMLPGQLGSIARTEITKLGKFQVMDRYDVDYVLAEKGFDRNNCYGKICLVQAGEILGAGKMLTGSVEALGETIVVTTRLIDVRSASIEKSEVIEFLDLREKIKTMLSLTLRKMFSEEVDENVIKKLTLQDDFESSVNFPDASSLNLSGPRMGFTAFSGELSRIYKDVESVGGFDALPLMFQFGYQFEVKYLNQGDFQALFEIIPIVTGLDQGKFIPSVSILNGMRSNRTGFEFAFGPVIYMLKQTDGFYDDENQWNKLSDWELENEGIPDFEVKNRLDSRGDISFESGFVFALGKTIKSGNLNIPINAFFIPSKNGHRYGVSMGFNALKYKR